MCCTRNLAEVDDKTVLTLITELDRAADWWAPVESLPAGDSAALLGPPKSPDDLGNVLQFSQAACTPQCVRGKSS